MKTIAIYPGNFQPAHRAHHDVYKMLRKKFGTEVFIAVTSGEPSEYAPLDVNDKVLIWVRHGVPASHIVKVADWKKPTEIYEKFSKSNTSAVFALTPKEISDLSPRSRKQSDLRETEADQAPDDPNKVVWVDAKDQPSYFQPYEGNESEMEPFELHGYVIEVDDSRIEGKVWTTSNISKLLGDPQYTTELKKKAFFKIFGWFDIGLYNILTQKFRNAYSTAEPEAPSPSAVIGPKKLGGKAQLKRLVREVLSEIMEGTLDDPGALDDKGDSTDMASSLEKEKDDKNKAQSVKQAQDDLTNHDMETKQHKAQAERDKLSYMNFQKITKGQDVEKKRALEKQLQMAKTLPSV